MTASEGGVEDRPVGALRARFRSVTVTPAREGRP